MKIKIQGRPEFQFQVTETLLASFSKLSEYHYDAMCRFVGEWGFIFTWRNNMKFAMSDSNPEPCNVIDVRLTWRDLDLLMKVCEFPNGLIIGEQREELLDFKKSVWIAMDASNKSVSKWNVEIE